LSWLTRIAILLLSLAIFTTLSASYAAAAVGPHGSFSAATQKCERCHAMHGSTTQTLLTQKTAMDLCISCHSKGIGADTAVIDGALLRPVESGSSVFDNLGTLLGGGFDSIGATGSTTSKHMIGTTGQAFGGNGEGIVLDCLSCHTPHDSPNYRLLRRRPNGVASDILVGWNGPWETTTVDADGKTIVTVDNAYTDQSFGSGTTFDPVAGTFGGASREVTRNYKSGISQWCSACHSSYMNRHDTTAYNAGDSIGSAIRYRHAVDVRITGGYNIYDSLVRYDLATDLPLEDLAGDGRTADDEMMCLTCHRAHGTAAVMTGETILASTGDRGSLPSGADSMLLRLDDRQICQTACHKVVSP
jgi:predicted CXXCH cytochrome family protein